VINIIILFFKINNNVILGGTKEWGKIVNERTNVIVDEEEEEEEEEEIKIKEEEKEKQIPKKRGRPKKNSKEEAKLIYGSSEEFFKRGLSKRSKDSIQ
jgi:hypothetical protein